MGAQSTQGVAHVLILYVSDATGKRRKQVKDTQDASASASVIGDPPVMMVTVCLTWLLVQIGSTCIPSIPSRQSL